MDFDLDVHHVGICKTAKNLITSKLCGLTYDDKWRRSFVLPLDGSDTNNYYLL